MDEQPPFTERAVARAYWLGELSQALEQAGKLTLVLSAAGIDGSEMVELRARIVAMRVAVGRLQRNASDPGKEIPLRDAL